MGSKCRRRGALTLFSLLIVGGPGWARAQDIVPGTLSAPFGGNGTATYNIQTLAHGLLAQNTQVLRSGTSLYLIASDIISSNACLNSLSPCSVQMFKIDAVSGARDMAYAGTGLRELFTPSGSVNYEVVHAIVDPTNANYFFILTRSSGVSASYALARINFDPAISTGVWGQPVLFGSQFSAVAARVGAGPNGAPVVVGRRSDTNKAAASRWTNSGSVDSTFGPLGVQLFAGPTSPTDFADVAVQSDNKVIAAGSSSGGDIAVVRYSAGSLDSTFGSAGIATIVNPQGGGWLAWDIGLQPATGTGRVIVRSSTDVLIGLTSTGGLDSLFGVNGLAAMSLGSSRGRMLVGPDGEILVAQLMPGLPTVCIRARNPSGSADLTFDTDGVGCSNINSPSHLWALSASGNTITSVGDDYSTGTTGLAKAWTWQFNSGASSGPIQRLIAFNGDVLATTGASGAPGLVYRSLGTSALVGSRSYGGTLPIKRMVAHGASAVLTAFGTSHRIYRSTTGTNLGDAPSTLVYSGTQDVVAMETFSTGVLIAFSGGSIYYGPSGFASGWGPDTEKRFDWGTCPSPCPTPVRMLAYQAGVITTSTDFNGPRIFKSPDGFNLGQAAGSTQLVFSNASSSWLPSAMIRYRSGVLTAFGNGLVTYSPDGTNLGGGGLTTTEKPLGGSGVVAILEFVHSSCSASTGNRCVITALADGKIYKSRDGHNLAAVAGNTTLSYGGTQTVTSMVVAPDGKLVTAFSGGSVYVSADGENIGGGGLSTRIYPAP